MKICIVGQEDIFQQRLLKNTLQAIKEIGCECQIEVVENIKDIMKFEEKELLMTPALIIDNHVLFEGHIWEKDHIKHYILSHLKNDNKNN